MEVLSPDQERVQKAEETLRQIGRRLALLDRFSESRQRRRMAEMDINLAGDERKFLAIERYIIERSQEILDESDKRMEISRRQR